MAVRIIVVEDEALVRELYVRTLKAAGFSVLGASDAAACRAMLRERPAELVLLDLGLPGLDGLSFARELRQACDVGLIIVSRRHLPEDRVAALDLGCDDYLVKPVHLGELCARAVAVARRRTPRRRVRIGPAVIDIDARTVHVADRLVHLTRGEFDILVLLVAARGRIVDRAHLCGAVSRIPGDADPRTVDSLIRRIRRKLEPDAPADTIVTAPGLGYRLGIGVEDG